MKRFIQGEHRGQGTLLPDSLDDYVSDTNPVRVVDVFVDELDLAALGFDGVIPAETGRPACHPAILLKINIYGYLNRIQFSRPLEREAQRNVELMWLAVPGILLMPVIIAPCNQGQGISMTVLLARADQAVSATAMARNFGANLKSVTSGEQSHLVVFKGNEPAAVLIGIEAFQAMQDELEDLRAEMLASERLSSLDDSKLMSLEDMEARFR